MYFRNTFILNDIRFYPSITITKVIVFTRLTANDRSFWTPFRNSIGVVFDDFYSINQIAKFDFLKKPSYTLDKCNWNDLNFFVRWQPIIIHHFSDLQITLRRVDTLIVHRRCGAQSSNSRPNIPKVEEYMGIVFYFWTLESPKISQTHSDLLKPLHMIIIYD